MAKVRREDALLYHKIEPAGKIEVVPTKPVSTQRDLSLAYSPGVAEPCKEIHQDPEKVYEYTAKGNLVGVISNGTAVLGLGNIGPEASKPVMEGKGVLFKKFAGIDVFDIEVNCNDPEEFVRIVKSLEPTFGGINLEDIKAPECFYIETRLRDELNIPVMHDDQHGTAIISAAALLNALELVDKKLEEVQLVVLGAGAAALSCTRFYVQLGIKPENIVMVDKDGILKKENIKPEDPRFQFATDRAVNSLQEALVDADVFLGLSAGNILNSEAIMKMGRDPIIFALANPDPEIPYEVARAARPDAIIATGRTDHPNQVNNVLGFPYIFRGALDVRATAINEEMKLAAAYAVAELAKEPVPDAVNTAYSSKALVFGKEYLIPKPLDPRLITRVAPAVAKAAIDSGVARKAITDWDRYHLDLLTRVGIDQKLISRITAKAKTQPKKVVFAEADHYKVLKAAQIIRDEGIGTPILLGNTARIKAICEEHNLDLEGCEQLDPRKREDLCDRYADVIFEKRKRKGFTRYDAVKAMRDRNYFGNAMLELGLADVFVSGLTKDYASTLRPALRIIGVSPQWKRVAGMYIINTKKGQYFFADTTVNRQPTAEELVEIIGLTADKVRFFGQQPRIAMLSYSNFGSVPGDETNRMIEATAWAKRKYPGLIIDGEMQANVAVNTDLLQENYPFSELANSGANTLIFPNLAAGNISYKLLQELGSADTIGPILMGMKKPVIILQMGASVREIVNMVAIGVVESQTSPNTRRFVMGIE